ncbi:MAG: GtrA family protein [Halieaceae bacterium]
MKYPLRRLIRYFFAGGCAAVVDLSIFAVFTLWLGYNYLVVAGVGFIFATALNYWLCVRYIFESGARFGRHGEIVGVFVVSGIGLLLHELILFALVSEFAVHLLLGKILAIGMVFLWNFSARNFYIFAGPRRV